MVPIEDRLNMRLDAATRRRLQALVARLELRQSDVIRQAIKRLAEIEGVEPPPGPPSYAVLPYPAAAEGR